jgi:hypothetical protein
MSERGSYRAVYSVLFDDPDYQRLAAPSRLLLLTLRQCRDAGAAAIFRYYREILRAQTGLDDAQLEEAFQELEAPPSGAPWIYRDAAVVWVRNALRYDPTLRLANERHRTGIENALKSLPHSKVVARFCDYYQIAMPLERSPRTLGEAFVDHSPPKPIPSPSPSPSPSPNTQTETEAHGSGNGLTPAGAVSGQAPAQPRAEEVKL